MPAYGIDLQYLLQNTVLELALQPATLMGGWWNLSQSPVKGRQVRLGGRDVLGGDIWTWDPPSPHSPLLLSPFFPSFLLPTPTPMLQPSPMTQAE